MKKKIEKNPKKSQKNLKFFFNFFKNFRIFFSKISKSHFFSCKSQIGEIHLNLSNPITSGQFHTKNMHLEVSEPPFGVNVFTVQ